MHDIGPRVLFQNALCQHADDVIALDETTLLVEQETAIEISVPGNTEVGAAIADSGNRRGAVLATETEQILYFIL